MKIQLEQTLEQVGKLYEYLMNLEDLENLPGLIKKLIEKLEHCSYSNKVFKFEDDINIEEFELLHTEILDIFEIIDDNFKKEIVILNDINCFVTKILNYYDEEKTNNYTGQS